jgi:hypothetical protein
MAYIPRSMTSDRSRFMATGAAGGAASGGMPIAAPPQQQSPAGGQFAGLRAFFSANQPNAEGLAGELASGVDAQAQGAVDATRRARGTYESEGGVGLAADAQSARDEARRQVDALGSQSGIAAVLEQRQPDIRYTPGQRSADAALLGRSGAVSGIQDRWGGILDALNPTYKPGAPAVQPVAAPQPISNKPIMDKSPGQGGGVIPEDEFPSRRRRRDAEVY